MCEEIVTNEMCDLWDFLGSPVVKSLPSTAGGAGSIPGQGTKTHMPHLVANLKKKMWDLKRVSLVAQTVLRICLQCQRPGV